MRPEASRDSGRPGEFVRVFSPFSGLSVCSVSPAETLPLAVLFSSSAHCAGVQTPADVEAVHAGRERCLRRVQAAGEQDLRLFKLQQPYLPTMLDDGFQVAATLVQVRDCAHSLLQQSNVCETCEIFHRRDVQA